MLRCLLPLCLCCSVASAQQVLFPDLTGADLEAAIVANYTTTTVLDYGMARDTLFAKIEARSDTLVGVYTGYRLYLPPGEDPTSYAFEEGGINTEHIYPRSKGAANGRGNSDMHHLAPTRIQPNADRGSLPFGEVPDAQAARWYYLDQVRGSPPPQEIIDLYSEWLPNQLFEPREDYKGNVARAVFYFYTIYRDAAQAADPDFFEQQRATLCQWHVADPVDTREYSRGQAIAAYQDGIPNPFVVDCSLAQRLYCPEIEVPDCATTDVSDQAPAPPAFAEWTGGGQDGAGRYWTEFSLQAAARAEVIWFAGDGRVVRTESPGWLAPGVHRLELSAPAGWYAGRLRLQSAAGEVVLTRRVVVW